MSYFAQAEINSSILENNIKIIKSITNNKLLAILKANAYGHSLVEMSKLVEKYNGDAIGVATVEEGIIVRNAYVKLPVIVLFKHYKCEAEDVCHYNLTPVISDDESLEIYHNYLKKHNKKMSIYIKLDTGLNRMGVKLDGLLDLAKKVLSYDTLILEGISTHYSYSDGGANLEAKEFTLGQLEVFNKGIQLLKDNNIHLNTFHTSNSAAILSYKDAHFDMVRAGILLYGYPYTGFGDNGIKPILEYKSKVVLVKKAYKGEIVSYGCTYKFEKDTKIAVIPVGYADGIPRALSNNWEVKIKGKYYPVRGRVCMDTMMVEVFDDDIQVEDDVLLYGNDERVNLYNIAKAANTSLHEILVRIGDRVKRVIK